VQSEWIDQKDAQKNAQKMRAQTGYAHCDGVITARALREQKDGCAAAVAVSAA
jgi:hypothetical protein